MSKAILKYPGAKHRLANWVIKHIPQTFGYVEPYCGSAAVYLSLPWQPKHTVLNDKWSEVYNLFTVIRTDSESLLQSIEMTAWSREEYDNCWKNIETDLPPVERARRLLVKTWMSQGNRILYKGGFRHMGAKGAIAGISTTTSWNNLPDRIRGVIELLKRAEIHNEDALDIITKYRHDKYTLYVDPPYLGSTRTHGKIYAHEMKNDAEHEKLAHLLNLHPGPVVLSGYDSPLYASLYKGWFVTGMQTQAEGGASRTEALWLNIHAERMLPQYSMFAQKGGCHV